MGSKKLYGECRRLKTGLEDTKDKAQSNHVMMTEGSVPLLIMSLSASTICTMLIATTYNLVDTYFVSSLGKSQVGAVGIMFSAMALIQAVGYTFGMGAGSLISRFLGKKDKKSAEQTLVCAFAAALIFGTIMGTVGLIYIRPLVRLLGATETIEKYALDYGRYILIGTPVMCGAYVLNNCLRSEGKPYLALFGIAFGGVTNILLDYLLIKVFNTGIAGAGIATLAGQSISLVVMFICFVGRRSVINLHLKQLTIGFSVYWEIVKIGMPSFWRQGLMCLAGILLNRSCMKYGDEAVAGMSIANKIFAVVFAILVGYGQGFAPVAGYNYGAKKPDRVKYSVKYAVISATIAMIAFGIVIYLSAPWLIKQFSQEQAVCDMSILALKAHAISMPFMPLCLICGMLFQAIGSVGGATLISASRQGIFFLPL
ncbi:MAG: MATE family efflux transporter, partial [Coprococcus sp.]